MIMITNNWYTAKYILELIKERTVLLETRTNNINKHVRNGNVIFVTERLKSVSEKINDYFIKIGMNYE